MAAERYPYLVIKWNVDMDIFIELPTPSNSHGKDRPLPCEFDLQRKAEHYFLILDSNLSWRRLSIAGLSTS